MTDCPSDDLLRRLISDCAGSEDDFLIDHVGECELCQDRLQLLAAGDGEDEDLESLLVGDDIRWPDTMDDAETRAVFTLPATAVEAITAAEQTERSNEGSAPNSGPDLRSDRARFGDYELIRQVGTGGMGVVYQARQRSANRVVAVKLIRPDQLALLPAERRDVWKMRFRAEAQAAARLDHEHVVTIYDVGEFEGILYYSMQYIEGRSLAEIVQDSPLENTHAAEFIAQVAYAVEHAHSKGILHRDIKPQNILVRQSDGNTGGGGTTVAMHDRGREARGIGRPYVADFGLAKVVDEGVAGSTHTGEIMGSPSFMSPEQARDTSRCTSASDVYSLGATLYFALTGRAPFRASSSLETLRQVIDEDPVPPRELNRAIDADLQTITLKALSKEPGKRYASAAELASDLKRYLRGEPVRARPVTPTERFIRWCRRNPAVAGLTGGIAFLLTAVAVISIMSAVQLQRHVQREREAREEAEEFFSVSMDVIHNMVTDYAGESLEHVPQMQQARRDLLDRALLLYNRLSKTRPSNPDLMAEYARTRYRIAVLHDLLGEVNQAKASHEDAIQLLDQLRKQSPDDPQLMFDWSQAHAMLAETLRKTDPVSAREHFGEALVVQKRLQERFPEETRYRRERSQTLNNLGLLLTETGDFSLAEKHLRRATELLQTLSEDPDFSPHRRADALADLGRSQINLGVLLRKVDGRANEARSWYERAIENLELTVDLEPENRDRRFRLAVAEVDLGNFLLMNVDDGKELARGYAASAAQRFAQLSQDFPGIPLYLYESANARNSLAGSLAMLGKTADSYREFEKADALLRQMEAEFPEFVSAEARFHSLQGRVRGGMAFLRSLEGDWLGAREYVDLAIESQGAALERQPQNPEIQAFLKQHRDFRSTVERQLRDSTSQQ